MCIRDRPGDKVERDEPLFEISTDKVDAEIPSPSAGVLKEIKFGEGQTVPIQTVVGVIDAAGSPAAAATSAPAPAPARTEAPAKPASVASMPPPAPKPAAPAPVAAAAPAAQRSVSSAGSERIHSSPLVRRMAKEHGIDLSTVAGTGTGGRISKQDIEAVIAGNGPSAVPAARPSAPLVMPPPSSPAAAPAPPGVSGAQAHVALESAVPREKMYFGHYEVQPLSVMRQRIAEHMVASKRVSAHVYSVDEIDMTRVAALRAKAKEEFEKRYETKLTFMPSVSYTHLTLPTICSV